jgi:hypothetical protein
VVKVWRTAVAQWLRHGDRGGTMVKVWGDRGGTMVKVWGTAVVQWLRYG